MGSMDQAWILDNLRIVNDVCRDGKIKAQLKYGPASFTVTRFYNRNGELMFWNNVDAKPRLASKFNITVGSRNRLDDVKALEIVI